MSSRRVSAPNDSLARDARLWLVQVGALLTIALAFGEACGNGGGAQAQGFGPIPVRVISLTEKPIREFDEYLASLSSRRSITLYPQVTGYIQRIHRKPGDAVKKGAILVEIDPGQQEATLRSLQHSLQTRKANLTYAIQNDESSRALVHAGLLSQLDYEQRRSQRLSAEADVRAAEAQVQSQEELLKFYRISAPSDGIVGDVPVKIGDLVTPQTRITSVDQDQRIEAYINIPITKANDVVASTRIALLGENDAQLCEETPSFIAPQVNADTQSVLVKINCLNEGALRTEQVLKARVTWSVHPGLLVPVAAATRQVGQYFVFVAERGPQGVVARQKPIVVGSIQENQYVVPSGLTQGMEVVVSNIQKLRDGAPVSIAPQNGPGADASSPDPKSTFR